MSEFTMGLGKMVLNPADQLIAINQSTVCMNARTKRGAIMKPLHIHGQIDHPNLCRPTEIVPFWDDLQTCDTVNFDRTSPLAHYRIDFSATIGDGVRRSVLQLPVPDWDNLAFSRGQSLATVTNTVYRPNLGFVASWGFVYEASTNLSYLAFCDS